MNDDERTTIGVKRRTKRRFERSKKFQSVSADEWLNRLVDAYEGEPDG